MSKALLSLLVHIGQAHGLPAELLPAIAWVESRGHQHVPVTRGGCSGAMQISPAVRARYNAPEPATLEQDATVAARYLASLRRRLGGWDRAIQAYNPGDGGYLRRVLAAMWRFAT